MNFEKLDKREFASIGIRFRTNRETQVFAEIIKEELEVRIGAEISSRFSNEKLAGFDRCTTQEECSRWLEKNCPNYRIIVEKNKRELENELIEYRSKIPGLVTADNGLDDYEDMMLLESMEDIEGLFDMEEDYFEDDEG